MEKRKVLSSRWPFSTPVITCLYGSLLFLGLTLSYAPICQGSLVRRTSRNVKEPYQFNWGTDETGFIQESWSDHDHHRNRRDTVSVTNSSIDTSSKIKSSVVPLNDSHNQLLVFWAGEDVILCLAKDVKSNGSSTLWISRDYGGTFSNATHLLVQNKTTGGSGNVDSVLQPALEGFFNHPSHNGHFAFTDVKNKVIFTTKNYGAEFTANKVDFTPDEIHFEPHSDVKIVAYEKSTKDKQMWVSIDFGKTWSKVQDHVMGISWDESVVPAHLYIQREEPSSGGSRSVILKSESLFLDSKDTEIIITGVEEFEIKDDFMFATKQRENGTYDLLISYKKSEFKKAIFPANQPTKHFFVADVSHDGQIFVCVVSNESVSNLYIGNFPMSSPTESPKFTLSLERILYFKHNVTWSESWLNDVSSEPFVDLHHVEGLRGVYIASQLKPSTVTNGKFNMNEVVSLITYDQGGEWQVLSPPEFEHDGRPIYCQYKSGGICSLHISQRLSELYPRTRAVPILSKKSAVGLVLATGTVNTTLKGHLGVYLSTDGAVTWRQILQGNYLYAFGDHGGIIVATKMYKIGDETNEILYSIDEGETWDKYQFYEDKVRIMGLMTEQGENTTVFFIFGSVAPKPNATTAQGSAKHTWVLIKVDFRDVFERNCTKDDYKLWSPWDTEQDGTGSGSSTRPARQCLLGRKEIYERRIPTHKCYNGQGYVRPVTNKTCACSRNDFECDFGYVLDSKNMECIRDTSETSPGVKPEWCRPSDKFYNKTRGYRKIPGDVCEEGPWVNQYLSDLIPCEVKEEPEFLLVAKRDSVLRIDLNHYERVETLPLTRVQAVIAVDFNLKNNCIFWSDVQHKTIMKLHLDGNSVPETLISTELNSVEGLAYDWMSNNLYFADGGGSKIEVVRVEHHTGKILRKRLLTKPIVEKPRGIAVHPEKGYIFWTDWSTQSPGIGRAHLDGSNPKKIVENKNGQQELTVKWPNGITVDYNRNRLFWVDANLDRMVSCDLNGENIQIVLQKDTRISHPFAAGVYKTSVYWDDWTTRGIYSAPMENLAKENYTATLSSIFQIKGNLPRLMDLKVYGMGMQQGENLCSDPAKSNCTHLCFMLPNNTVSCKCPDGFVMQNGSCVCPDGKPPNGNLCESRCEEGRTFQCRTHPGYCIINEWRCDGENDCGDMSDEENCDTQECQDPTEFKCKKSGRCIPQSFKCDYDHDCGPYDMSDEENCESNHTCDPLKHFQCANGRCILKSWRCDEDDDCLDESDEQNCTDVRNGTAFGCLPSEWKCPNENKCLSPDWLCDFDQDCQDGSDELNCTSRVCPEWKFACKESGHCIMKNWQCDGDVDCPGDGSDEENCPSVPPTTVPPENPFLLGNCSQMSQMFECLGSKECIPIYWKCDGVNDCENGSDELGCADSTDKATNATIEPPTSKCELDHWRCNDGTCIASYAVCDGFPDCRAQEDELNCHNVSTGGCPKGMRRCGESRACIAEQKWCNGKPECPNRADELECPIDGIKSKCNSGSFKCDDDMCMPLYKRCDGKQDCYDGQDENQEFCKSNPKKVYQVEGISVSEIDTRWLELEWWLSNTRTASSGNALMFIPEICEVESGHCHNETKTSDRRHVVEKLSPFKKYSITVYVADGDTVYPPFKYINATTAEDKASAPWNLVVKQNSTDDLYLTWQRPHSPNGNVKGYKVYFQPPIPPTFIDADKEFLVISNKQSDPVFVAGENYTFWVTAVNGHGEGDASPVVSYVYNGEVAFLSTINPKGITESSARISWEPANSHVDKYAVLLETQVPGSLYTFRNRTETTKKLIDFENLSSGTRYKVTVIPMHQGLHGSDKSITFTTKGSPLARVDGLKLISSQSGTVKLSWRPVKITGAVTYGIYYGKTVDEMAAKHARIITTNTQAEAVNLTACENYLFDIGLVTIHNGIGPLTEKPLQVVTKMNPQSPPKSVEIERLEADGEGAKIKVNWKAPCDVMDQAIGYNITIMETTQHKVYGVSNVQYSLNPQLSHILKLQYGGHYQLTVSTNVEGGKPSAPVYFDGPAIPFPEKIQVCADCHPLTIFWVQPTLPKLVTKKGKESYVVWLSEDEQFTDPKKFDTENPSFKFDEIIDDGIYYAAVSVKDADGLESPRSTPIIIQHTNGASPIVLPGSSALAITITVLVVIVLLVAVLGVFVVKHKRLQTSFLNFASSHYSSSSGAATFQQQNIEDQDSPVIRGFSDDEPLLVA